MPFQEMGITVGLGADRFVHRIVGLDKQISVVVPRESLDAVCQLHIRLGAEVVLHTQAISFPLT